MTMAHDLLQGHNDVLRLGGTQVDLHQADGVLKQSVLGAFVNWTTEDQGIRNDFDKEAQKYQMAATAPPPEKMDYILFSGDRWTILDVHTRIVSGVPICHVCVIRR